MKHVITVIVLITTIISCLSKYPEVIVKDFLNILDSIDTPTTNDSIPTISKKIIWYEVDTPERVRYSSEIILPASRDYHSFSGIPLKILFNHWVRDPYILNAPDGYYYMVGTTERSSFPSEVMVSDNANGWWFNDGIPLWRSRDLEKWETMGYVWTFEDDATWSKKFDFSPHTQTNDGSPVRAIWAPEIHYLQNTYWIVYSMNYNGLGILKSMSGKPEGPYRDINPGGPLPGYIDGSLFEDTDGSIYYLTDGYRIAKMKPDMSGLAEELKHLTFNPSPPWAEGITMMKVNDNYVWYGAGNSVVKLDGKEERTYDCFSATSKHIYGPYENRYRAIPYAGHNNIFKDKSDQLWSTQFHPQPFMLKDIEPAIIPVEISDEGFINVQRAYDRPIWKYSTIQPEKNWLSLNFNDADWEEGAVGFGKAKIQNIGSISDVGTNWSTSDIWLRKIFFINKGVDNPCLFLRYVGDIQVWINEMLEYEDNGNPLEYLTISCTNDALRIGENVIAVKVKKNQNDYQYVDIGIIDKR